MISASLVPVGFALLVWWVSTGIVLLLVRAPRRTYAWSMGVLSVLLVGALHGVATIAPVTQTSTAAYLGFLSGLMVWAWQELSYLTGYLTGPRKLPCPPGVSLAERFRLALATGIYHEITVILAGLSLLAVCWGQPNKVAFWTYLVLWVMRWSAKLNLFFGVRNFNEEWFPHHLKFLTTYLRRRAVNPLFPVCATLASAVAGAVLANALSTTDPFARTAGILVFTMLALAVLEHWMLLLPVRGAALWDCLSSTREARESDVSAARLTAVPGLESSS